MKLDRFITDNYDLIKAKICSGKTTQEIANSLNIAPATLRKYVYQDEALKQAIKFNGIVTKVKTARIFNPSYKER